MFIWAHIPGVETEALVHTAISHGVAFVPGRAFSAGGEPTETLRLSFATANPEHLSEAACASGPRSTNTSGSQHR